MPSSRIIIDTNVIVAGLRSRDGASFKLLSLIDSGRFSVAITVPLLFEYEDVIKREHLGIDFQSAEAVLDYVCAIASHHQVHFMWRPYLRDPKDDLVLEAAVAAEASHIVTFNTKDFEGIGRFGIQALWPADFLIQKEQQYEHIELAHPRFHPQSPQRLGAKGQAVHQPVHQYGGG